MREVDLVVRTGAMLPMTGPTVVYDALLAIDDGRFVYAGKRSSADYRYVGGGERWPNRAGWRCRALSTRTPMWEPTSSDGL